MERLTRLLFLGLFFLSSFMSHQVRSVVAQNSTTPIHVGVVLDLVTQAGKASRTSISMAIDDFYSVNPNYTTRIILHTRDSEQDIIGAASTAVDLLKNVQVQAIIGPMTSAQAEFVADLGNKTRVPILSFSATSPSLSPARTPYFVRTTVNDSSQAGAIAAIIKSFEWREVVPIYEDTEYGAGIVASLVDALQAVDAIVPYRSMIPPSPSDDQIAVELYKLMTMQTRVFVVHMMPALGSRLFTKAAEIGMMGDGYVWIATDGVTNKLDHLEPEIIDAMQGVVGVIPYVPKSKEAGSFTARWRERFRLENPSIKPADPTVFQMWAYDTAWALALAAEKAGATSTPFQKPQSRNNSSDLAALGVSQTGPELLDAVLKTRFRGLAGDFQLVDGQLQSSAFQIVNVIGKGGRVIGFWTPAAGLSRQLNFTSTGPPSARTVDLKPIIWPGDSTAVPKGWEIPTNGKKLQIGVPVKNGFNEFVNVEWDPITNATTVTGYCIDVFDAVMQTLPYAVPYEYIPFGNLDIQSWTYDDLVHQVPAKKFDAVVGDVTIVADRANYVDFTLPYTESGWSMIAPIKVVGSKNMWIFLKPLTTDLWLGSLAFFFFTGLVVWVLEHRINEEFRGPPSQQLGLIFYFAFSTLVFAHKEKLESNLSRFAVIIWVFVVLILTSSYTASLTSMLTVQQFQPAVADVKELLNNKDYVGYQDGSFVLGLLKKMNFDPAKLVNLSTSDQYAEALSRGSRNGGVAAIFDEIPYLKLFLSEHCTEYTMVGQTYKTDGFGFVFPRGSSLVSDVSRAVLNVTEGEKMTAIERKWFGDPSTCTPQSDSLSATRLNFENFGGLFLITGAVSLLALFVFFADFLYKERKGLKNAASERSLARKVSAWAKHYDRKDLTSHTFKTDQKTAMVASGGGEFGRNDRTNEGDAVPNAEGSESPFSVSNSVDMSFVPPEEGLSSTELGIPGMENPLDHTSIEITQITGGN